MVVHHQGCTPNGTPTSYFAYDGEGHPVQKADSQGGFPRRHRFEARELTPHRFVGKAGYYADGDSGMLLLGHRYYLPGLQRGANAILADPLELSPTTSYPCRAFRVVGERVLG